MSSSSGAPTVPPADRWETVVGLEVHVELATETKLFSAAPNRFGEEPNTCIDPVVLGLPGSLPVLNEYAIELSIRAGLALNCEVRPCVFARKNYFYPDMPKDYQISQYDRPLNVDGHLELPDGSVVGIERAHLEEDTGKTTHVGGGGRIHDADYSLVDYNRAGVPLLEIVSRPDIRSAEQARAYVEELQAIVVAIGASDGRLEQGSMRVDANISVRPAGTDELRTRCEVKNVNSMRSLVRAIEYEATRQIDLWSHGEQPELETRHWDEQAGRTTSGRSKEEAEDYRYFAEPDLVPVEPDPAWIDSIRASLPELPAARRNRLVGELGADPADAALLVQRGIDRLVIDAAAAGGPAGRVITHAVHNLADATPGALAAADLAALATMEADGALTATQAKQVVADMVATGRPPAEIAHERGFEAVDGGDLEAIVDAAITDHPDDWAAFCSGEDKVMGFFVGQVMKATQGNADGKQVSALLRQKRSQG